MPFKEALPQSGKSSRRISWISLSGTANKRDRNLILYIRPSELELPEWFQYKATLTIQVGSGEDQGKLRLSPKGSWPITRAGGCNDQSNRALRVVLPMPDNVCRTELQDVACKVEVRETYIEVTLPKIVYASAPSQPEAVMIPKTPYVMGQRR